MKNGSGIYLEDIALKILTMQKHTLQMIRKHQLYIKYKPMFMID